MKSFGLVFALISFYFVCELTARDDHIGIMPAGIWPFNCPYDVVDEDVPPYLMMCIKNEEEDCIANASVPFVHWLQCKAKIKIDVYNPATCYYTKYTKCDITCSGDPGRAIYRPLYHPEEKLRLYDDIMKEISHMPLEYIRSYVTVLRKTFTSVYYRTQYNYGVYDDDE